MSGQALKQSHAGVSAHPGCANQPSHSHKIEWITSVITDFTGFILPRILNSLSSAPHYSYLLSAKREDLGCCGLLLLYF